MSLKMITKVSELDFKNKHLLKYVLFAMANYANSDDEAWPSYPTIAKFCSITERSAINTVKKLVKLGYLIKTSRVHSNGRDTSNLYKFDLDRVHRVHSESEQHSPQRVNGVHPSKDNLQKEPPIELGHSENDHDSDNLFSDFYKTYPKKVKKDRALKIWNEKKLWVCSDDIKANIEQRKKCQMNWVACKGQQKQYIPAPDVYLRNKGWEDELELSHKDCKSCLTKKQSSIHEVGMG